MDIVVLVKYLDGRMIRGKTLNIGDRQTFHFITEEGDQLEIPIRFLKAVFFLKSESGHPEKTKARYGKKLLVQFSDGEEITGTSFDYNDDKDHFFLFPLDKKDNNERILVNRRATTYVKTLGASYGDLKDTTFPDRRRKSLEHKVFKVLYALATEISTPDFCDDEHALATRCEFYKIELSPLIEQFEKDYDRECCIRCVDEKLNEIQNIMGNNVYDTMKGLMGRIVYGYE